MIAADDPRCYSPSGCPLKVGTSNTFDTSSAGYTLNAADGNSYTEPINAGPRNSRGVYEIVWTGAFDADITVQGRLSGPFVNVNLDETIIGPNATNSHSGNLDAADLTDEDVGTLLINLSGIGGMQHRVCAGNCVGTGTANVRWRSMEG